MDNDNVSAIGLYLIGGLTLGCFVAGFVAYWFITAAIAQTGPAPSSCYSYCTSQARANGWTREQFDACFNRCTRNR